MKTRSWYVLTDLVIVAVICAYASKKRVITPQFSISLAEATFQVSGGTSKEVTIISDVQLLTASMFSKTWPP